MDSSSLYRTLGGAATCRRISEAFYARVDRDPLLRPLFPGKTLTCAIEAFAAFLAQILGGPGADAARRWHLSLRESHAQLQIGAPERDAWLRHMLLALDEVPLDPGARDALRRFFERASAYVARTAAPAGTSDPTGPIHAELARRWTAQEALDAAIAAVRSGRSDRALELAASPALRDYLQQNKSVMAAFLAVMLGRPELIGFVSSILLADPSLVHEPFSGRTLLHAATAVGDLGTVELLLGLGSAPDAKDTGGHTPLYAAANQCLTADAAPVIRALVRAGAAVDACEGVKRCTALHMAARRGNPDAAQALLDAGAAIEARDSLGETPLRRAVNCNKLAVARLLLTRGADRYSIGSKGLTPQTAARTAAMRELLRNPPQKS